MEEKKSVPDSTNKSTSNYPYWEPYLRKVVEAKRIRREQLAALPYEEKVRIVVELQKMAQGFERAKGNPRAVVWDLGE